MASLVHVGGLLLSWQQKVVRCVCTSSVFVSDYTHYSIRDSGLTDTGAIALARALQHNRSLEELK